MRIDLPLCNLKTCRYCFDGNCTDKIKYEQCNYTLAKEELRGKWTPFAELDTTNDFCPNCGTSLSKLQANNEQVKTNQWCKFKSEKNCDFCAFHSDCEIRWREGEEE